MDLVNNENGFIIGESLTNLDDDDPEIDQFAIAVSMVCDYLENGDLIVFDNTDIINAVLLDSDNPAFSCNCEMKNGN